LEGKNLLFKLKEPFDAILRVNGCKEWLPGPDSGRLPLANSLGFCVRSQMEKLFFSACSLT